MKVLFYKWLPWMVLCIGLGVTYVAQRVATIDVHHEMQRELVYRAKDIATRITQRMMAYEQVLRGVRGLFVASAPVTRARFRDYVSELVLEEKYPGIQGVGFSLRIPPDQKAAHIESIRLEGFPEYSIRPDGERALYTSILYLEPFTNRNLRAFGFDMYSDDVRRAAMEKAWESGKSVLSGKVKLVQEDGVQEQPGFLLYVPVYHSVSSQGIPDEYKADMNGWTHSTFRASDLMEGILGRYSEGLDLEIFDGSQEDRSNLLYDSDGHLSSPRNGPESIFRTTDRLGLFGRVWTLSVRSLPSFEAGLARQGIGVIHYTGILASVLFALLVWQLVTGRARAVSLAEEMTRELRESELERRRSEALVRAMVDTVVNAIIVIDANKIVHLFNPAARRMFGYSDEEILGQNVNRLIPDPVHGAHDGYVDRYLASGERVVLGTCREVFCLRKDESQFQAELFISEMNVGGFRMFVGVIHDITDRKRAEESLILARRVFENAGEAILITDAFGKITDVNPAYERITGYARAEVLGKSPNVTKSGRHAAEFYKMMWNQLTSEGKWEGEIWDRRKNGEIFPKWVSISAIRSAAGDLTNYMAIFMDITDQKAVENKLERLAFYDALTGLPNRMFFRERLAQDIMLAKRQKNKLAVMFIDLDRFKWVNDTLGHEAGDGLLKEISHRLKGCVRESDTVARMGGDEFTIILTNLNTTDHVAAVAQKIISSVREPVQLLGQNVYVGASVGISMFPVDSSNMETLIKHADMAMYQAKEAGRNTFRFASSDVHTKAFDRISMEDDLYKALDRQELVPYYQPKWDLIRQCLCGAEALVRWIKPDGKLVNPGQFIPLAEETGLILPIGKRILETATSDTASWTHGKGNCPFKMAVNLSSREFQQADLLEQVRDVLAKTGLSPERLEIEITESMVMGNVEKAIEIMNRLRDLGISLAMDDFGTGYSSLGYLKRFPLSTLKIDQSFVRDLPASEGDGAIVEAILSMAKGLKMHVVAEGVETEAQKRYLEERGCESIQGYLIGRPMPEADFARLLPIGKW
ncbi:MAG: EAL domain-containing protein [Magnetococcales bacterium]|nr:EAL domain-containing protein [Magnetococcales bacterium]